MTNNPLRRRGLAFAAAAAVAASTLLGTGQAAQAAAPPATHGVTVDYFDDVYDALGADSVFETVTIERFEYILKSKPGNFAFLIGDPKSASTQATIGHVNAVAKQYGIDHVYNFTPKLDGDTLNVWDLSQSNLRTGTSTDPAGGNRAGSGLAQYETLGNRLISDYLNKDTQTQFTKNAATDPYLFVYNKDRTVGGEQDRIVSALSGAKTAADLDTSAEVDAYRADVLGVLDDVPADQYATNTQFDFNKDEHNRRHFERYVKDADPTVQADKLARFGGDIFDDTDDDAGFRIETITYPELIHLLGKPGDIPILFGGTWCHNTAAIIKDTNRIAQEKGIKTVYNFDFSLDSTGNGGNAAQHIRDNALLDPATGKVIRPSHLYGDLVNEYLTNASTQYRKNGDPGSGGTNFVAYYPGGDTTKPLAEARKIQVGHLLTYNKDHQDALGNDAPVVDQAIRTNDDGGNTEHMTEWWFVKGRDLAAGDPTLRGSANPASESGSNGLQSQRAFAKEGIDEIDTILGGLAGESVSSTTTVAGLGGAEDPVPALGSTPSVKVTVTAPEYGPFISLNTAGGTGAPNNSTGKPRGVVALYKGAEKLSQATLKRDGTATLTLPAQTAGQKSYTVKYSGRGDAIAPSSTVLEFAVPGNPSTTSLDAPATLTFGTGGTATATVTAAATGKVSLAGLPGGAVESTVSNGTATFDLPATIPAGTHELVATYKGDDTYGSSSSTEVEVKVAKAASTLTVTPTGATYGKNSTIQVEADGPDGYTPTGQVTITVNGAPKTVTLDGSGRGTLTLSKTLSPKTYAVTAVYAGDTNLIASSKQASVVIGKGAVSKVAYTKTASPTSKKTGKATVTVTQPTGLGTPTGTVTVSITKGSSTKTVKATLSGGKKNITLPKLKKGTWKVTVSYAGDTRYAAKKSSTYSLSVTK